VVKIRRVLSWIEGFNDFLGRGISWLMLGVVGVCFTVAILRYVFSLGWIWLQESYVWLNAIVFMVGMGYTLLYDSHVRVDIFYRSANLRYKAWVDLLGTLFFLFPFLGAVWWACYPYVAVSWERLETSREAGGLPALYLLKSFLLVFVVVLLIQGIAVVIRSILVLKGAHEYGKQFDENKIV